MSSSFLLIAAGIWAAAMLAWFMISRYVQSADIDKVKARLLGAPKTKKKKEGSKTEPQVLQQTDTTRNRLAQMLVDRYGLAPKLGELLEQAGLSWQPARFVHLTFIAFLGGTGLSWVVLSSVRSIAVFVGLAAAAGPFIYVSRKRKLRLRRFEEIFPEALEFVSRSMRHREFQEPVSGEFRRAFEEHNLGLPMEVALQKLAKRVPSLDVHFFVSAVLLQKRTGGNLAEILDKLAYVIRERFKLRGRIRAVSAHGRMTASALSLIPIAVAVLMFYTNPEYVKFFFTDDVGNIMLGAAVALQVIGYLVMRQIVNIEV
jgi:tight adherence protein B